MKAKPAPLPAPSGEARIAVRITAADHVRLNILRAKRQKTMQALVRDALELWLASQGEPPLEELQP